MSATQRTDAETLDTLGGGKGIRNAMEDRKPDGSGLYVRAEFARKLERELTVANELASANRTAWENAENLILVLTQERDEWRKVAEDFKSPMSAAMGFAALPLNVSVAGFNALVNLKLLQGEE